MRVSAWINRFVKKCHHSKHTSPLTTSEIKKTEKVLHQSEQKRLENSEKFQQDRKSFKLVRNTKAIYECRGRIQGSYPIYLPILSYSPRISTKYYYPRIYEKYEKANSKTGESEDSLLLQCEDIPGWS